MRISDWSSDVCSSDLHQSGRGSGDHGRARLRFLQHLRPSASARPMSNTAVLENALLPLRPLLAREDVTERSEEHTSELQSLMRISYAVFCLKKKKSRKYNTMCTKKNKVII